MKNGIFLLLGSNQGNPADRLADAAERIGQNAGRILTRSSLYRTEAWGMQDQPEFYNQVLKVQSSWNPQRLLEKLLAIEESMGRVRVQKWGPRIIDIDLLFYHQRVIDTPDLQVPHPGIPQRKFTLLPLSEIAPDFVHPVSGKSIATLLKECRDPLLVERVASPSIP